MVLAVANRGFDISDEGLYVLLADPLQENQAGIFNYDLFFKLLFRATGYSFSLVELRILRLLSYLLGAWALAAFWKNIRSEVKLSAEMFALCFLGLLFGYGFLPPTLSYNSLAVVLLCFWLYHVSFPQADLGRMLFIGVILGLLVYVKISLALVFYPLTLFILWKKTRPASLFALFLPLLLLELLCQAVVGESASSRLALGIPQTGLRPGYQVGVMLKVIAVGVLWTLLPAGAFALLGYLRRTRQVYFYLLLLPVIVGAIWICKLTSIAEEWTHVVLIGGAGLLGFCFAYYPRLPVKFNPWAVLLFLFPYLLHFGSNVYWLRIAVHYGVFWMLGLYFCFGHLRKEVLVLASVFAVVLVFNGLWWHPFGQDEALWKEKVAWVRPGGGQVYLDPVLVKILKGMDGDKTGERAGELLAIYRMPGLAWLSGKRLPNTPGIWDREQLDFFIRHQPEQVVYNQQQALPAEWVFGHRHVLGTYQQDSLIKLWK
ncbi:hypothetical protein J0A68_18375 [Algoriphagus sp. H41]|uniref:Glycosyltransferase RgtA/B/C/D-like domain-containing protein n=1 Tax=Algoriphagus oliviformis TaxID=2811231 RepID=A0ABS3C734_9BACT|nr:hypothetical protein [Algoriphagus oliviformis]MBN7812929.1 hypothetical protein [Algoriphagus oliviformis]